MSKIEDSFLYSLEAKRKELLKEIGLTDAAIKAVKELSKVSTITVIPEATERKPRGSLSVNKIIMNILITTNRPYTYSEFINRVREQYKDVKVNDEFKVKLVRTLSYLEATDKIKSAKGDDGAIPFKVKKRIHGLPKRIDSDGMMLSTFAAAKVTDKSRHNGTVSAEEAATEVLES